MAVYFYYGEEDYNIDLAIDEFKSKLNPDFLAMSFQKFDNPKYPQLITALRTPPMMFGKMLVLINAEKYFLSKENNFEDSELDDIKDALSNCPESLDIIFYVKVPRDDDKKIDSRRKLFKILSQFNSKEFEPIKTYKTAEIVSWIKNRAKKKDISISDDVCEIMIEQIGNNLRNFDTELDKLKLIAYPDKKITKNMVEEIVISNQDLFNITEMIIKNQKDKALFEFTKLTDKKHPLEIISAIQTMLRKWIILKTKSSTTSAFELSKLVGQHEFVVKQTLTKLKNTSVSELVRLKQNLYDAECRLKSGESTDINSEVEIALIR